MKRDPAKCDPKNGKHSDGYKSHFESKTVSIYCRLYPGGLSA